MADDQLRRLLKERRGWKRAQTAFQNRQARSGDKEMAQLDMLMRRDRNITLAPRPRAVVFRLPDPAMAQAFFRKQHVRAWLGQLAFLKTLQRFRRTLKRGKMARQLRSRGNQSSDRPGVGGSSILSISTAEEEPPFYNFSLPSKRSGGKTRVAALVEKNRQSSTHASPPVDSVAHNVSSAAAHNSVVTSDDGTAVAATDADDTLDHVSVVQEREEGREGRQEQNQAQEHETLLENAPPDAAQETYQQEPASPATADIVQVRENASEVLKEFLVKSPWGLKFQRGLRRVRDATECLQQQCVGFVVCKHARLDMLQRLWRRLEAGAMAAVKRALHAEELRLLLPRTPGVTPEWLVKSSFSLSIARAQCVEATAEAKIVGAKYAHLESMADGPRGGAAKKRKGGKKKKAKKKKGLRDKEKKSGGTQRHLHLPKMYDTNRHKTPDDVVQRTCLNYLVNEKRMIFQKYMKDKEVFREKLLTMRQLENAEVQSGDMAMDAKEMGIYLHESPYCLEYAVKIADENKKMDQIIAHRNRMMKEQRQMMSVPLESLRVFSGPAKTRFEAEMFHVIRAVAKEGRRL